jgi:hypothetical protein
MPNHFTVVALCGRNWERLEQQGKEDFDFTGLEGANLCEILAPLPDELQGIVETTPPCRYRHKQTGEWSKDSNTPMGDDVANWERVDLTDDEQAELRRKYDAVTWYDWQPANWGTKWGTYDLKLHELGGDGSPLLIEFQTAWRPPNAEMMRRIDDYLCDKYCLQNIKWIGYDPYDDRTKDIDVADAVSV